MLEIDSLRISGIDPIGRAQDNENLMLDQEDYFFLFDFIKKHSTSPLQHLGQRPSEPRPSLLPAAGSL